MLCSVLTLSGQFLGPVINTLTYCTPHLNFLFVKWVMTSFWKVLSLCSLFGISPVRICCWWLWLLVVWLLVILLIVVRLLVVSTLKWSLVWLVAFCSDWMSVVTCVKSVVHSVVRCHFCKRICVGIQGLHFYN